MTPKTINQLLLAAIVAPVIAGCSTVKVTGSKTFATPPVNPPAMIYVGKFDWEPDDLAGQSARTTSTKTLAPVPAGKLAKLQVLMAASIAAELNKAGYNAVTLSSEAPIPSEGWLIHGSFVSVDKGNLAGRMWIGLGVGKTDVQVVCVVDRLSQAASERLFEVHTEARDRKTPGAIFTPLPVVVVVHLVVAPNALEKDVRKTAAEIAAQIQQQLPGANSRALADSTRTDGVQ